MILQVFFDEPQPSSESPPIETFVRVNSTALKAIESETIVTSVEALERIANPVKVSKQKPASAGTFISAMGIMATEQWLRATKSTLTPYDPAHRRSPATAQSPRESLRKEG